LRRCVPLGSKKNGRTFVHLAVLNSLGDIDSEEDEAFAVGN
jgi:hypothetical protein